MKPQKHINFFVVLMTLFLVVSCATRTTQNYYFYTTNYSSVHDSAPPRDNFMENEIPTIVLINYNGHKVHINVVDLNTGRIVRQYTDYIPKEHVKRWHPLNNIDGGSYKAVLKIKGNVVGSYMFNVSE